MRRSFRRAFRRALVMLVPVALVAACSSNPVPPVVRPAAPVTQPAAEPTPSPAEAPVVEAAAAEAPAAEEAPAPAAPPVAPARWWHDALVDGDVPSANIDGAYELLGDRVPAREIIVAVIDGGVETQHEDLDEVLWNNPGEIPGNDIDDDGNGYVDDVYGWNFLGGANGESVDVDTYEKTRIHAACIGDTAGGEGQSYSPDLCSRAAAAYEEELQEMTAVGAQLAQISQMWPQVLAFLTSVVGEEPTPANVTAIETSDPQTLQAKEIFLGLSAAGVDDEMLAEQSEQVNELLDFGLDTNFNPRSIVGDNYGDASEANYGNNDVEGPDPFHGTAVASVIASERDNGNIVDGVATGVRIMAIRAVPNGDERDKDVANAIRYAVDNGAHIINMSFGKDFSPSKGVVDAAVRYADAAGVLMVHAAGNDGADLAEGSNFPNVMYEDGGRANLWIEVGASGWESPEALAASFSNYGAAQVDIFAPGVDITAAALDDEYEPTDGTSFASPLVAGVAGLLMAYFPDLDAAAVKTLILETATDASGIMVVRPGGEDQVRFGDLSVTGGIVNAAEAVRKALEGRPVS